MSLWCKNCFSTPQMWKMFSVANIQCRWKHQYVWDLLLLCGSERTTNWFSMTFTGDIFKSWHLQTLVDFHTFIVCMSTECITNANYNTWIVTLINQDYSSNTHNTNIHMHTTLTYTHTIHNSGLCNCAIRLYSNLSWACARSTT